MRRMIWFFLTAFMASAGAVHGGEWISDPRNGCAVWNAAPQGLERIEWSGSCVRGKAQGAGLLQWYSDDRPADRYEGTYEIGKMHGQGILTYANGDLYKGGFRDDEKDGLGLQTWAKGNRYEGTYRAGKEDGHGVHIWANGRRYEGDFQEGKMHGMGVFTWEDGGRYQGRFDQGKMID